MVDEAWVRARIAGSGATAAKDEKPPTKKAKVETAPVAAASGPMSVWFQLEGKRATRVSLPAGSIVDDLKAAAKEKCAPILDAIATMDLCVYSKGELCQEDDAVEIFLGSNSASTPLLLRLYTEEASTKPAPAAPVPVKAPAAPKPTAAAPSTSSVVAYLECQEGSSDKFYELSQAGSEVTIRYGRRGTPGVTQVKSFGEAAEADKFVSKTVAEKRKKGYRDVAAASSDAPPAPLAKAAAVKPSVAAAVAPPPAPAAATAADASPAGTAPLDGLCFAITGIDIRLTCYMRLPG